VTFFMEIFSLVVEEEKNLKKNNEGWKTFTYKNEHEMKNISWHGSTYFLTSYTNKVFFYYFLYCYQTDSK